jgi:hypothetical protein
MKRLHKAAIGFLALAAAGLTVWSAAAMREQSVEAGEATARVSKAVTAQASPAADEKEAASPDKAPAPAAPEATSIPVPSDVKVGVRATAAGRVLHLSRQGPLVTVLQGRERRIDMHKVAWTLKPASTEKLVFETTNVKTLETVRGELSVSEGGATATAESTVLPVISRSSAAFSHLCKGHDDGAGGFVVLCQVDVPSAAVSVEGPDPKDGVWSLAGEKTIFRFDMPMGEEGADTKVIGYERGGRGVVVRVEASRVKGEPAALLAIGADSRTQPERPRPRCCSCRFPRVDPSVL